MLGAIALMAAVRWPVPGLGYGGMGGHIQAAERAIAPEVVAPEKRVPLKRSNPNDQLNQRCYAERSRHTEIIVPSAPKIARPAPGTAIHSNASLAAPVLPIPGALNPAANQNTA